MSNKVPFKTYEEFTFAADKFVMTAVELFFSDNKSITKSEKISYLIDFIMRFNEWFSLGKLNSKDLEYLLDFFTIKGLTELIDEAFEFTVAPILIQQLHRILMSNFSTILHNSTKYFDRVLLRQWLSGMLEIDDTCGEIVV